MGRTIQHEVPRVFAPLLAPSRYKGAYGGRGSAKSHFFAELLVKRCLLAKTNAVCIREFQSSLEQSCKRLIEDKIAKYQLEAEFRIMNTHIETPNGGTIIFQGMKQQTADSIKSLEGFDVAWVEEAQSLSERSLTMLRPTIRKEMCRFCGLNRKAAETQKCSDAAGHIIDPSELWFSWNPRSPKDPVDKLLRCENRPPDAVVIEANYTDNPWFPEVLRKEMEWDRGRDPEMYAHVWLGQYEKKSESRVFKNWVIEDFVTPEDTLFLFGADWGFSADPTVMVRCFINGRTLYIDHEVYQVGCEIDATPALFDRLVCGCDPPRPCQHPNQHGMARPWPIVADSARPETISYLQKHGYTKMEAAVKGKDSVKEGIIFLQGYDIKVHPRCVHTINELTYYSYKKDPITNTITPILEDKKNHVIDSLRYAVEHLRHLVPDRGLTW